MIWIYILIGIFLLNVFLAGIMIPQILLVAFRNKLFDKPDPRKIHKSSVPRLGGISFSPVIIFSFALLIGFSSLTKYEFVFTYITDYVSEISCLICAGLILFVVGLCDDLIGVKYRAKFVAQIICALLLIVGGICLCNFGGFFGIVDVPYYVGIPLTILLVVFIVNAINLIDGLDGLASGLCGIAMLYYTVVFYMLDCYVASIIAIATLGVLVQFFYYNVFAKGNRKIFMGDTGSLTIGILTAYLSIKLCSCGVDLNKFLFNFNPLVVAFAPLMIPCLDVIRVFSNRIYNHKSPFLPDKTHIHHKLLKAGFSKSGTLVTILISSVIFTIVMVVLSIYINVTILLIVAILLYSLCNYVINVSINKRKNELQKKDE